MDCLITLFEWNERNRVEIAAKRSKGQMDGTAL